ncbi:MULTISPECIES: helix-turn-helix domain-containing protein [Bradyrhizobium]|uniref:helix-turn-helix domain-containing protein n=1 Tax=Bradyrhizobium centrosematis TaxID=1300039 RepID=UPI0035B5A892
MDDPGSRLSIEAPHIPNLDPRQLRYAVIAADFGSLRQAADVPLVKQTTLSRSIRKFEHLVGIAIFERSNAGIRRQPQVVLFSRRGSYSKTWRSLSARNLRAPCLNSGNDSQIDLTTAERSGTLPRAETLKFSAQWRPDNEIPALERLIDCACPPEG